MKSNKSEWMWSWITGRGHVPGREVRGRRRRDRRVLPERGLRHGPRRPARAAVRRRLDRRPDPLRRTARPGHGGRALPGRRLHVRRQHGHQERRPAGRLQGEARHLLQREEDPEGAREGPRSLRLARLLRVHGVPRHQAARARVRGGAGPGAEAPRPPDHRRDDAGAGREAVLRQPHHLRREHHHPRQRHPPRDPPLRGRRVQHRGAEVQRQAAEPARLLQAARGRQQGPDDRQDARRRQQGRRQAQARGAEPQPADVRRGRVAVRGVLRPADRSRRRTSWAAARPSPCRSSRGRGRGTTRSAFSEPFLFDRPITARRRHPPAADPLPVHLHAEHHGRRR